MNQSLSDAEQEWKKAITDLVTSLSKPQWLDEPTGDGWYWIKPTEADKVSQYSWRFVDPRKVERTLSGWIIRVPSIGCGHESLDGRQLSPISRRPE